MFPLSVMMKTSSVATGACPLSQFCPVVHRLSLPSVGVWVQTSVGEVPTIVIVIGKVTDCGACAKLLLTVTI